MEPLGVPIHYSDYERRFRESHTDHRDFVLELVVRDVGGGVSVTCGAWDRAGDPLIPSTRGDRP